MEIGTTTQAGQTSLVNSEMPIGLKAYKSIMRETERVKENWGGTLDAKLTRWREPPPSSTPSDTGPKDA